MGVDGDIYVAGIGIETLIGTGSIIIGAGTDTGTRTGTGAVVGNFIAAAAEMLGSVPTAISSKLLPDDESSSSVPSISKLAILSVILYECKRLSYVEMYQEEYW